jgi:hypothetical protein
MSFALAAVTQVHSFSERVYVSAYSCPIMKVSKCNTHGLLSQVSISSKNQGVRLKLLCFESVHENLTNRKLLIKTG